MRLNCKLAIAWSWREVVLTGALIIAFGSPPGVPSAAGAFTNSGFHFPGYDAGALAWGDYNRDGRLDLLLSGWNGSTRVAQLWRNVDGGFMLVNSPFPDVVDGSFAWGDYDNDGWLDLLLTGEHGGEKVTQVWHNDGNSFSNINAGLPGVYFGSAVWGDCDNDGKLDILLCGYRSQPFGPITQIWRNTGTGFTNLNAGFSGVYNGDAAWGDYDNDGWLDVLLAGRTIINFTNCPITQVWRNTGNGFTNLQVGLPGIYWGAALWGDYDNDGRLDIFLTGQVDESTGTSQLWRNTGSGFCHSAISIPGLSLAAAAAGDYDNDGWLDLLLAGWRGARVTEVWRNTHSGFASINPGLPGVSFNSVGWADFDKNGTLDVTLMGYTGSNLLTQVWANDSALGNQPPSVPTALTSLVLQSGVRLSWGTSLDLEGPVSSITYNLRVGTRPGAVDIVSPQSASNGWRMLPQPGNCQARPFAVLTNLASGIYYWSVQAVDSAWAGSPFAPEQRFAIGTPPLTLTKLPPGRLLLQGYGNVGTGYSLQFSSNLLTWVNLTTLTPGSDGYYAYTNATSGTRRFYRLKQP